MYSLDVYQVYSIFQVFFLSFSLTNLPLYPYRLPALSLYLPFHSLISLSDYRYSDYATCTTTHLTSSSEFSEILVDTSDTSEPSGTATSTGSSTCCRVIHATDSPKGETEMRRDDYNEPNTFTAQQWALFSAGRVVPVARYSACDIA